VRPEHLHLGDKGLSAEVTSVEHTGAETYVRFETMSGRLTGVFRDRVALSPGERVHVAAPGDRVHLFDRQTGRRIEERETAG
jgi:multiple sugar transport system ATP-binding protein